MYNIYSARYVNTLYKSSIRPKCYTEPPKNLDVRYKAKKILFLNNYSNDDNNGDNS